MWSLYKQKQSTIWWVSFYHNGKRVRRSTGETDRTAANEAAKRIQAAHWVAVPKTTEHTWGQAVLAWLDVQQRSESELLSLKKFGQLYPDRPLSQVTRESVHEVLAGFCKTPGTYMRYRTMLAAILNLAKQAGWLDKPPILATRRETKPKPRVWLTYQQWERLYNELPTHMRTMATFAIETGLRQANVLGLKWAQVDLDHRLVWVEAGDAKARKAISVPLSDKAFSLLSALPVEADHVFLYRGKPVKEIKTAFIAACVRAGLGSYVDGRYQGFTWHGFRHTWATWHKKNGTPDEVLQKLGAWQDGRMVKTYAHFDPGFVAQYVNNTRKS